MWMGGVFLAGIGLIAAGSATGVGPIALIPFGMFLFGYALIMGAFKFESAKAKRTLAQIFQGSIEEA